MPVGEILDVLSVAIGGIIGALAGKRLSEEFKKKIILKPVVMRFIYIKLFPNRFSDSVHLRQRECRLFQLLLQLQCFWEGRL